ncbi:MAG: hypothetical protein VX737_03740 [Pseudomonadota bacterium]|nr:hypothetical protein [Pseudomonadota bacterium]
MKSINKMLIALWGFIVSMSSQAYGMKEISTITTPEVLYTHRPGAPAIQETVDFKTNTIAALKITIANFMIVFKHFIIVLGFGIIIASLFQYFKYKENPHAMRLSYVGTTFFCGLALVGLSYITGEILVA